MNLKTLKKPQSKNILTNEKQASTLKKEKLTAHIQLSLKPSEKIVLEQLGEEGGLKLSTLIRNLLKHHKYI